MILPRLEFSWKAFFIWLGFAFTCGFTLGAITVGTDWITRLAESIWQSITL